MSSPNAVISIVRSFVWRAGAGLFNRNWDLQEARKGKQVQRSLLLITLPLRHGKPVDWWTLGHWWRNWVAGNLIRFSDLSIFFMVVLNVALRNRFFFQNSRQKMEVFHFSSSFFLGVLVRPLGRPGILVYEMIVGYPPFVDEDPPWTQRGFHANCQCRLRLKIFKALIWLCITVIQIQICSQYVCNMYIIYTKRTLPYQVAAFSVVVIQCPRMGIYQKILV